MDPKQTSPLGATPAGGQEGQSNNPPAVVGGSTPVFSSGPTSANPSPVFSSNTDASKKQENAANVKMAGTLGAENLSTGANVSRTMASLNSKNQSATGTSVFSKHKFDRAEPDGTILIPGDSDGKGAGGNVAYNGIISSSDDQLDPETLKRRKMMKIGAVAAIFVAVLLIGGIAWALISNIGKSKGGNAVDTNYQDAFSQYANYTLYGTSSSTPLEGEYDYMQSYQLDYSFSHQEITEVDEEEYNNRINVENIPANYTLIGWDEFYKNDNEYLNNFKNSLEQSKVAVQPYLQSLIDIQTDNTNFLNAYSKLGDISNDFIISSIENDGLDATIANIENMYTDIRNSSKVGEEFANTQIPFYTALARVYGFYYNGGCITNGVVSNACTARLSGVPEGASITEYTNALIDKQQAVVIAISKILNGCFHINEELANQTILEFPEQEVDEESIEGIEIDEETEATENTIEPNTNTDSSSTNNNQNSTQNNINTNQNNSESNANSNGSNTQSNNSSNTSTNSATDSGGSR